MKGALCTRLLTTACAAALAASLSQAARADDGDQVSTPDSSPGTAQGTTQDANQQGSKSDSKPDGKSDSKLDNPGVPLWEAGLGAGVFSFPAYRGSSTVENYVLPVPYFVYHGDFFKSDRRGVRGDFVDNDWIELSIAVAASPPTRSDNVPLREGMPDLKPTLEVGPELDITLWRNEARTRAITFRAPVRWAFTVQDSPRGLGIISSPHLNYDISDVPGLPNWNVGFWAGPVFATRAQNAYFYTVLPMYATPTRPAYSAGGGYAGAEYLMSLSRRFGHVWLGAFVRYDNLDHASFENSPLVARRSFLAGGIGVSYIFAQSTERVERDE